MKRILFCSLVLALPMACAPEQESPSGEDSSRRLGRAETAEDTLSQFENRLLDVAKEYESFGRLDSKARWAPTDCRAVSLPTPPGFRFSESNDSGTHGRKMYSLFVKESSFYASEPNPVGQVIVKEAWVPEAVKDDGKPLKPITRKIKVRRQDREEEIEDTFIPYARMDDRLYRATEKFALFIMFKMDPKTPSTDQGWVYGTVTADGKKVTSAGRVESCMKCHEKAPHDRLFGWQDK